MFICLFRHLRQIFVEEMLYQIDYFYNNISVLLHVYVSQLTTVCTVQPQELMGPVTHRVIPPTGLMLGSETPLSSTTISVQSIQPPPAGASAADFFSYGNRQD